MQLSAKTIVLKEQHENENPLKMVQIYHIHFLFELSTAI